MKKRISRMISAALSLALCLGMALIPASAAEAETSSGESGSASGFTSTVVVEGVSFYVSGDTFAVGSQLTVGTADLEEGEQVGMSRAGALVYLTTAGGPIGEQNYGFQYLQGLGRMLGIPEARCVAAENLDVWGCDPESIVEEARERAIRLAQNL